MKFKENDNYIIDKENEGINIDSKENKYKYEEKRKEKMKIKNRTLASIPNTCLSMVVYKAPATFIIPYSVVPDFQNNESLFNLHKVKKLKYN
jgi:hypothetical protein